MQFLRILPLYNYSICGYKIKCFYVNMIVWESVLCKMSFCVGGIHKVLCVKVTKCKKTEIIFEKPVDKIKVLCYTI